MSQYNYRAKKGLNEIVQGSIEAHSEKEAIEKLSAMGYLPMHLEEASQVPQEVKVSVPVRKPKGKVKSREITIVSRQLASLLRSGVPILEAISIIREQSESEGLKIVLYRIHDAVKEGSTLSGILESYPGIFSPLYIAMVRTGENSGGLAEALLRISDYRAKEEEMLSRFRMAMAYPALMGIVGIGTIVFMLTFVMPRLMGIFSNMGQNLPLPTQILLFISKGLQHWWFWILLVLGVVVLLIKRELGTKTGKATWSLFKLSIPVFGKFTLKVELARFSRTLELLLKSGLPILKALEIAMPILGNEVIKEKLMYSCKELEQGGSFGKSLKNSKLFPLFMSNLISVGEESGNLADALSEVANSYEHDSDEMIRVMSSLLEPLMILGMGLIVGFIVVSMLLPVFEINMMAK